MHACMHEPHALHTCACARIELQKINYMHVAALGQRSASLQYPIGWRFQYLGFVFGLSSYGRIFNRSSLCCQLFGRSPPVYSLLSLRCHGMGRFLLLALLLVYSIDARGTCLLLVIRHLFIVAVRHPLSFDQQREFRVHSVIYICVSVLSSALAAV